MNTLTTSEDTLQDLYNRHLGKVSDKWHSCLVYYNEIFDSFRHKNVRVLEIGVQNGGSLELWAKYFPNAEKIVGCDIDSSCSKLRFEDNRISVVVGDATTAHTANEIFKISEDFDIVIDDGSHESGDIIRVFSRYFGRLIPGGVFVVEDLHCSYWKDDFNGGLHAPFSSVSFFKRIIDMLNYEHWGTETDPSYALDYFSKTYDVAFNDNELRSIECVTFRNSVCVVHKAECERVHLGTRVVVGEVAGVTSEPICSGGMINVAPDQSSNVWGPNFGSIEQIVASAPEKRRYEEQQQKGLEREERKRKTIESLVQQKRIVTSGANDLLKLIQTNKQVFSHPIRSRLTSAASSWAARFPSLSDRRREKFLRSAQKRDVSGFLDNLISELNGFLDLFEASDAQYQEQIVASAPEERSYEEQQQEGLEREERKKKKIQKTIVSLVQQKCIVTSGTNELLKLIQTNKQVFSHPIRSRLTSAASSWAARFPSLSNRQREKFLCFAQKRDVSGYLDNLISELNGFLDLFEVSDAQYQTCLKADRDGTVLPELIEVKEVDIVVCCHNALECVKACLSSIVANTSPPYRLILVDDGSNDETKRYLESFADTQGAVLIRVETAGGYTRAANRGLRASASSWTILLNSDTIVPFGWIGEMLKVGEADPRIGIIGPASNTASWQSTPFLLDGDGDWAANPLPEKLSVQNMQEIASANAPRQGIDLPFINGFAYMIRRELIEDIGVFDEKTFGTGYGEENDYCVRARKAGWELVFAPNSYVYHAQSKSYSTQERLKLAANANDNLMSKYDGDLDVVPHVAFCRDNLATSSFRARFAVALEDKDCPVRPYTGKRVALLCPIGYAGGGGNILVEEARCLERLGAQIWLINLHSNQRAFEETYKCNLASIYFGDGDEIRTFLQNNKLQFDAIVASAYFTVDWLPDRFDSKPAHMGYYIQDDEPAFFQEGTLGFQKALQSYSCLGRVRGFTKTNWNADAIEKRGFPRPVVVGASVDLASFRPKGRDVGVIKSVRFAAMLRFEDGKDRRAPARTMRILNKLVKLYGQRIELFVFGSAPDHPKKIALSREVTDFGILHRNEVATLFRSVDIFLDFSDWQAMGLSAMEAMASGCAVVVPLNGGVGDYCVDQESGLIVDSLDDEACYDAARRLVDEPALLGRLKRTAAREICSYTQERTARRILDVLFGDSK